MMRAQKRLLLLSLVAFAFTVNAEKAPYSRYTNIIERQMFGPLPADFDPTKLPSEVTKSASARQAQEEQAKKEEQLRSAISFSMINVTPDGEVKVGFTDKSKSPPVNYYMGVGEEQMRDGWVVKEADPEAETMTIAKDEIEITLTIGGDSSKSDKATKKRAGAENSGASVSQRQASFESRRMGRREERVQMANTIKDLKADRERERAERAKADAETAAKREELRNELQQMRQMMQDARDRQSEAKPVAEPVQENSEESNNENDDAQ